MSAEVLSALTARSVAMTPKEDTQGVKIKLKVFWKTTKFWTPADVADFQKSVPQIAERLRTEQYWNKDGDIRNNQFTCEDFAICLLCEYASSKGLPVKLTTDVRTYRNMEMYSAEHHDRYASNIYGFSEMVMLTYGAPDMQRTSVNTIAVEKPEELLPGDVLAQAQDRQNRRAHHIQIVVSTASDKINIYQGNSGVGNWASTVYRIFRHNPADPKDSSYTGKFVEIAYHEKDGQGWNYKNLTSGTRKKDFLKDFEFYRWNFMEFNK